MGAGWVAAIGAIVGAGMQAQGASQSASASKNAAYAAKLATERYTAKAQSAVLDYEKEKLGKLEDIGTVLDRLGAGAFGLDTSTQANLRKSQESFSELAAGQFGNFEALLRTSIKDSLAGSMSSPVGAFTNISALNQFQLMTQGAQAASSLTNSFDTMSRNLLNMEFGIMDQSFVNYWNLEKEKVANVNAAITRSAQSAGTGLMAAGQAVSTAGSAIAGAMNAQDAYQQRQVQNDLARSQQEFYNYQIADSQGWNNQARPINIATGSPYSSPYTSTPTSSYNPATYFGGVAAPAAQPDLPQYNGGFDNNSLFTPVGDVSDPALLPAIGDLPD